MNQLGARDRRNGHAALVAVEYFAHLGRALLEHVDDDVRVKQVREHCSGRFAFSLVLTGTCRHEVLAGQSFCESKVPGSN